MESYRGLAVAAALSTLVSCASPSAGAPAQHGAAVGAGSTAPQGTGSAPVSSPPASIPRGDAVDVIVSASGGGGLVDALSVRNLTVLGDPTVGRPWLRFDVVFDPCC